MTGKMNSQANLIHFQPNLKFEKNAPVVFVIVFFVLFFPCLTLIANQMKYFFVIYQWNSKFTISQ